MKQSGKVRWFNTEKGFGFIIPDERGEKDVFIHVKELEKCKVNHSTLLPDVRVVYVKNVGPKGAFATELSLEK